MRCLKCGKLIQDETKSEMGWHKSCIRSFFGCEKYPVIDLRRENLERLVSKRINKRSTVAGVQKKISLHFSDTDVSRLTLMDYPAGYILKPQTDEYESLPEYEHLSMQMAEAAGIKTVPHALVVIDETYNYITKRIDRDINNDEISMYAMEDFCQLSNKLTEDKYKGSYEQCGRIIKKYSYMEGMDLSELFIRIVFCFLIGNSDMHLKNFSLIESAPGARTFRLSEAYDMLPVNLILPSDNEETALMLNGKKRNLRKKDFIAFANSIGITENASLKMIKSLCSKQEAYNELIDNSLLNEGQRQTFKELVDKRISILE